MICASSLTTAVSLPDVSAARWHGPVLPTGLPYLLHVPPPVGSAQDSCDGLTVRFKADDEHGGLEIEPQVAVRCIVRKAYVDFNVRALRRNVHVLNR